MKRYILSAIAATIIILSAATTAFAFCGGPHRWAGEQATWLFRQGIDLNDPTCITADHGGFPIYPELLLQSHSWDPQSSYKPGDEDEHDAFCYYNWEWIMWCSQFADDACVATLHHFWKLEDGLQDKTLNADNSWEVSNALWVHALSAWNEGDLGWAYTNLGYCMHHVQDMLQPAHSNGDKHAGDGESSGDDAIEEWFDQDHSEIWYAWDGTAPRPGPEVPYPNAVTMDNHEILQAILNTVPYAQDEIGVFPELTNPDLPHNMQKYFYLLYWANQVGSYFASDDDDGKCFDPCGWMDYTGFPTHFHDGHEIWDCYGLDNNDTDCDDCTDHCRWDECDADWDLTLICNWCYAGVFKVSPALIDLFRYTVDARHPVTTTEVSRADGLPVVEWNNSPVRVVLIEAVDEANPGFRPSGVWWKYGECDGNPPADINNPSFLISEDGKHLVECLSTDWCGNVENNNEIDVWVDMTPPEVTFPDLRPNYLTSEDFTATWVAYDETSGVASEIAYLDGHQVTNGQVFDLALMAGLHTLRVIVADKATNWTDVTFQFEVFIDATSWAKPVLLGDKTKGTGLHCAVEFPAPYNVALINVKKCTLVVKGTLDLTAIDPVVGGTAILKAENITGVGDSNSNKIRDRMLRFNKESFVAALGGQTGMIPSVVRGGLGTGGMPRFLAVVQIPVFAPPPK